MAMYGYTLAVIFFGALLVHVVLLGKPSFGLARLFTTRFMTRSGKYSYALYMVHVPVASTLLPITWRASRPIEPLIGYEGRFVIFFAASFAVSWALAFASWQLIEKRLLALKRYFAYPEAQMATEQANAAVVRVAAQQAHTGG